MSSGHASVMLITLPSFIVHTCQLATVFQDVSFHQQPRPTLLFSTLLSYHPPTAPSQLLAPGSTLLRMPARARVQGSSNSKKTRRSRLRVSCLLHWPTVLHISCTAPCLGLQKPPHPGTTIRAQDFVGTSSQIHLAEFVCFLPHYSSLFLLFLLSQLVGVIPDINSQVFHIT